MSGTAKHGTDLPEFPAFFSRPATQALPSSSPFPYTPPPKGGCVVGEEKGVEQEGARQSLPPATLATMREDFALIVANRKAEQGWTDADAEELGSYIAEAKSDLEAAEAWRIYLATEAAVIRRRFERKPKPC